MSKDELIKKAYLKGYEKGLDEALRNAKSLISRYDGWELKSRIESKLGTIYQDVASKRVELEDDPSIILFDESVYEGNSQDLADMKDSFSYLFIEEDSTKAFDVMSYLVKEGIDALVVSREKPSKLILNHSLPPKKVRYIQLTRSQNTGEASNHITSSFEVNHLSGKIGKALKGTDTAVVLFEGVPKLIAYNDFEKVLKFFDWMADKITNKDSYLLVSLPGNSMEKKQLKRFQTLFDKVVQE